jgi:hypothetical protein
MDFPNSGSYLPGSYMLTKGQSRLATPKPAYGKGYVKLPGRFVKDIYAYLPA